MLRYVRPSHAPSSTVVHFVSYMVTTEQYTNRKPTLGVEPSGQRDHFRLLEVVETTATKPSPAQLQKHSLGGCTTNMLPCHWSKAAYRFATIRVIPWLLEMHCSPVSGVALTTTPDSIPSYAPPSVTQLNALHIVYEGS